MKGIMKQNVFLHRMMILIIAINVPVYAEVYDDEEALFGLYGDEEFISIATGTLQPIAKAPAVATVRTAQDIQDMGATDLDEVLETIPGLHVSRDPFGYQPAYIFRGIYSKFNPQVLVLINGVPLTNLFHGDRGLIWGGMPVNAIARIEVIRGPGSAVYGADAFAGVINIITKSYDDIDGAQAGIRSGSYKRRDLWYLGKAQIGEGKVSIAIEGHKTDGQDEKIDSDAQTNLDSVMGTDASLAPGSVNLSRENLDVRLEYAVGHWKARGGLQRRSDFGNGAGIAEALDPHNRYLSERWNVDFSYYNESIIEDLELSAQLSYLDTSQEVEENLIIFPPGSNIGFGVFPNGVIGNPEVFERHSRFDLSTFYRGIKRHSVRVGLGYYYGDLYRVNESKNFGIDPETGAALPAGSDLVDVSGTPYVFLNEGTRRNRYLFMQDIWDLAADWEMTAGVRWDEYSDFGDTVNPRLALVWSTSRDLTTKLLYGKAFRSPSFTQTRAVNNPSVIGNPNLDPETIDSVEVAFDYRVTEKLKLGLNIFGYKWADIIKFTPDENSSTSTAANAGTQIGKGFEAEADWRFLSDFRMLASFSLQDSYDRETHNEAPQSPGKRFFVSILYDAYRNWQWQTQFNWVMDRKRDQSDTRDAIEDYRLVDVTLRRLRNGDPWALSFSIKNVFNSSAKEPSPWSNPVASIPNDLPLAGRNFTGEIEYQF